MEKTITIKELKDFTNKIINDPFWNENNDTYIDYLNYVSNYKTKDTKTLDRESLTDFLSDRLNDFDDKMDLCCYEIEDLETLNLEIAKELLPLWTDKTHYYNIGALIKHYDLDIDELYFDVDSNVIRDKEGNIWAD